ncbi:MAG: hypothetical protein R3B06_26545 [Kofleriaceae bacterium]
MMRAWMFGLIAAVAACKQGSAPAAAPTVAAGAERGSCRPDRSCDVGLTCLSDLCVRPPPADCTAVAAALGGIFLDNYTPVEERARYAAEVQQLCAATGLTREDGACLAKATSRADLQACPHPLGLGDCGTIATAAEALRANSAVDAYLVTPADRLIERCKREVPSLAFERCVVAAATMDDLGRCAW